MKNDAMNICYYMKNAAFEAGDKLAAGADKTAVCDAMVVMLLTSWFGQNIEDVAVLADGLAVPMVAQKKIDGYNLRDFSSGFARYTGPCFAVCTLDGDEAYTRHLHEGCTSIAFLDAKQAEAAIVYDPIHAELFHAVRGMGAYLNGKSIKAALTKSVMEAYISVDHGVLRTGRPGISSLLAQARYVRAAAACGLELCNTACGRTDAVLRHNEAFFEYAAGLLIAQEAGVVMTEADGSAWMAAKEYGERRSITAACHGITDEISALLADR